ncbi:hypothetical protein ACSBR1_043942 (mitochondrion) [Camellia fascicularis]
MKLKEGNGISAAEKEWIFGIKSAQISGPGKLRFRMCRKSDQWIFGCFMGLRTGIRGSVDGGKDSAMEALE